MVKRLIPIAVAIVMIIIIGVVGLKTGLIDKYSYSEDTMDMNEYYQLFDSNQVPIILGDENIEQKAYSFNGANYLPLNFVTEYLNGRFYYDEAESLVLYTTPTELYQIPISTEEEIITSYTVNAESRSSDVAIATLYKDEIYLAISYVEQFANFSYTCFEEPARIQIYLESDSIATATIKKNTALRYQGGVKSDVVANLSKDDTVYILEKMDTWTKVKTQDSYIGYVENKRLKESDETIERTVEQTYVEPEYTSIHKDFKINMAWHQVTNVDANASVDKYLENTQGINVISPTWFYLASDEGAIASIASQDYVTKMHNRGIEVWALVDDFTGKDASSSVALKSLSVRTLIISQLIQSAIEYDIDGINVDFEKITADAGRDFVEFIRELSIECRKNNIVLSIDNYVPQGGTDYYNRSEQGVVADYVVIMGYDEHYSGSEVAGSVASINYVEQGIIDTMAQVPAQKVINGVPFYTRLWDVTGEVSSEAMGMQSAKDFLSKNNVEAVWDDETCQHYAEFRADAKDYQIWLEDAESLRTKLNVMAQYNLAGVAEWKLGFETPDVWTVIGEYLKGNSTTSAVSTETATQETEEILEE